MKVTGAHLNELIKFTDEGPVKNVFYDRGPIKAQVMCLKAGQVIPPCQMSNDVLFFVIKGVGEIRVDDECVGLQETVSVIVPKEAGSRSISAQTDLVILAVQAKSAEK